MSTSDQQVRLAKAARALVGVAGASCAAVALLFLVTGIVQGEGRMLVLGVMFATDAALLGFVFRRGLRVPTGGL